MKKTELIKDCTCEQYEEFPWGITQVGVIEHHVTKLLKMIQEREDEELMNAYMVFIQHLDLVLQEFIYEINKNKED